MYKTCIKDDEKILLRYSKNPYFSQRSSSVGTCALRYTVHEMARDEARHGKALKGLLDRYFG